MNEIGLTKAKNVELASKKGQKMLTAGGFEPTISQTKELCNPEPYPLGYRGHIGLKTWEEVMNWSYYKRLYCQLCSTSALCGIVLGSAARKRERNLSKSMKSQYYIICIFDFFQATLQHQNVHHSSDPFFNTV